VSFSTEWIVMASSAAGTLLLLIFAVDWRYFRDWVVVFLFKGMMCLVAGSIVVELNLVSYPVRLLPNIFDTSILFEVWIFPTLSIIYNQVTRKSGPGPIFYYALLFGGVIAALEYPLELYTALIHYEKWSWFTSFLAVSFTFLISRLFIAFYRWGCGFFGRHSL